MRKIKVLHIDTGKSWRGGQKQVFYLHKSLKNNANVKSILLCNEDGLLYKNCVKENLRDVIPFFYSKKYSIKVLRALRDIIKRKTPDIIHCHDSNAMFMGVILKRGNCKLVHTRRVSYPVSFISKMFFYNKFDAHICVSDDIKKYLDTFTKSTFTIHSCVNLNLFKGKAQDILVNKGVINLLFVGSFTGQKGIDILLKSFAKIDFNFYKVVLHLVGDGKLIEKMKELSKKLKIDKNVVFYGKKDSIEKYYFDSDIVVIPSIGGEGSCGTIKEGMAAGKPVIASNLKSNLELITHNFNGILFENKDIGKLSESILKLIQNKNKRLEYGEKAKKTVEEFDIRKTVEKNIELYRRLSGGEIS